MSLFDKFQHKPMIIYKLFIENFKLSDKVLISNNF